jgi:hypothetical protein
MHLVHRALAHHGGRDGERAGFLNFGERRRRGRQMNASAGHDERRFRPAQKVRRLGDPMRIGDAAVERKGSEGGLTLQAASRRQPKHIGRRQQDGGARPSRSGYGEGHVDVVVDTLRPVDPADPFRHRIEQPKVIELLEGVLSSQGGGHLLNEGDDRARGLESLRERGNQQGRGGPVLRGHNGDAVGDPGVPVRHNSPRILGAVGGLSYAMTRRRQMERGRDALAENDGDAVTMERFGDSVCHGSVGA